MPIKVHLNHALTNRDAQQTRSHLSPSKAAFDQSPEDQKDELLDALIDTYMLGLRHAVFNEAPEPDPELNEQFPHVYRPSPGRCLWNMADIQRLNKHQSLKGVHALCQRPSDSQTHLEGITPLHALLFSGYKASEVVKLSPFLTGSVEMSKYLKFQDFGRYNHLIHKATDLDYTPPRNSKRTPAYHWAIQIDVGNHYPLATTVLNHPPVRFEMMPKLKAAWAKVHDHLAPLAPYHKGKWVKATLAMASLPINEEVVNLFLGMGPYQGTVPYDRLYRQDITEHEHAVLACTRTLTQLMYTPSYYQGACTLAISLLSGVSPAVFARTALDRFQSLGVSFLTEGEILKMAQLLSLLDPPRSPAQQVAKDELIDELERIAEEMGVVRDAMSLSLQEELYTMISRPEDMPAWGKVTTADTEDTGLED